MKAASQSIYGPRELWLRRAFIAVCAVLLAELMWQGLSVDFIAGRDFSIALGLWSMRFLMITVVISPVSRLLRRPSLKRWRRLLGLAAFAFAIGHAIHYVIYANIWPSSLHILILRPYLLVGCIATVLLLVLAATSTDNMVRRLSPRAWRRLHTAIYLIVPLSVLHEVMAYGELLGEAGLYCVLTPLLALERWFPGPATRRSRLDIAPAAR